MANFEKMVAAPKEKRYPPSPKRDAANIKNLGKAWATPRKPSAAQVEQEELSERLASLFPAYPPQEARIRGSGLRAREPELGNSGRDTEPQSGIPNPEPRTPDPDPGGVGTKPECGVESTDSSSTSPSRIQQDASIRDSGSGAGEAESGGARHDADDDAGPESEFRASDPEFEHQEKPRPGADAVPADDQSTVGNR